MIKVATDPESNNIVTHYTFTDDSELFAFLRMFESYYPEGKWLVFTLAKKKNN
jgi:hypothetical protein